jgi:oxygen-dependent protoporphyrinogen oxidase
MLDRDDADLVRTARSQISDLLNIDRAPMFSRVFRFRNTSPQFHVGHIPRVKKILARAAEHPGLHLGGGGYLGSGIPDMVRTGEEIAARIIAG